MKELISKLQGIHKGMFLNPGVSEAELEQFEKDHAIRLSPDYRQWLQAFNGGELFAPGYNLCGIPSTEWNLVNANDPHSRRGYDLPADLYIIGVFSFGDPICMDTETFEIVQWDHELQNVASAWDSFRDFLADVIETELNAN